MYLPHIKILFPSEGNCLGSREGGLIIIFSLSWMKAIAFEDPENLILQTTDLDLFKIFFSFWNWRQSPCNQAAVGRCVCAFCFFSFHDLLFNCCCFFSCSPLTWWVEESWGSKKRQPIKEKHRREFIPIGKLRGGCQDKACVGAGLSDSLKRVSLGSSALSSLVHRLGRPICKDLSFRVTRESACQTRVFYANTQGYSCEAASDTEAQLRVLCHEPLKMQQAIVFSSHCFSFNILFLTSFCALTLHQCSSFRYNCLYLNRSDYIFMELTTLAWILLESAKEKVTYIHPERARKDSSLRNQWVR